LIFLTAWMAIVAALYATAGQAGGSGFVAVMTFGGFFPADIRPISLLLNIVAASYATLQIHRAKLADWPLLGALLVTSVPAAFLGGTIILRGAVYFGVTGTILLLVSALMAVRKPQTGAVPVRQGTALIAGAVTGLASGITGIGGGAILSAILILFAKASAKKTAALSPLFILANSVAGLVGVLSVGQRIPFAALPFAAAAIAGAAIGMAIGRRWMSEAAIRYVLAVILLAGAAQMLAKAFS